MLKKEKIKIIAATIFLLITLSTFVLANTGSHETQDSYYQFDVYFARNVEIEKLVINGAINFYDYGFDKKIFIVSPDNEILTTTAFGYEKPSLDDVRFLSDKNAIIDFFADNEIIDVEMYEIILCTSILDGYILYAKTADECYFVPILFGKDTYGVFQNKKIYTREEFGELNENDGKLIVDGKEIACDVKLHYSYGYVAVPLRALLENVGVEVFWNQKEKCATFGDLKLVIAEEAYPYNVLMYASGELHSDIFAHYIVVNDRILINDSFLFSLGDEFGFEINFKDSEYVVEITT